MTTPAHQLLDVLKPPHGAPAPTHQQIETAFDDFVSHIRQIEQSHVKKSYSDQYLSSTVFLKSKMFKQEVEFTAYCRCQLVVARRQLEKLVEEIRDPTTRQLTAARVSPWERILRDFIFDLIEPVSFLQRKVTGYVYLDGGKNPTVHSWQVYLLSLGLANHSAFQGQQPVLDHKPAQIASIAVLRQALELRFERIIGVYLHDKRGKNPKLKHGFHQDFLMTNIHYFKLNGLTIDNLKIIRSIYDWCSEIVHQAYQPYAWQTLWALELAKKLLGSPQPVFGQAWSIAGAVEITNVVGMQEAYEDHFLKSYDHGSWRMTRVKPEALVRNWVNTMAFTATDYRPVFNRRSAIQQISDLFTRFTRYIKNFFKI